MCLAYQGPDKTSSKFAEILHQELRNYAVVIKHLETRKILFSFYWCQNHSSTALCMTWRSNDHTKLKFILKRFLDPDKIVLVALIKSVLNVNCRWSGNIQSNDSLWAGGLMSGMSAPGSCLVSLLMITGRTRGRTEAWGMPPWWCCWGWPGTPPWPSWDTRSETWFLSDFCFEILR